jgi:sphingolipid delta-4 desaturase
MNETTFDSPRFKVQRLKRAARSVQSEQHVKMRVLALAQHPELAHLFGNNPWTALAIPVMLVIHWGTAALVQNQANLLFAFVVAFFVGQWVIHATGGLVHETAHRMIFRGQWPKSLCDFGLEMVLGSFSKQLTYQHEHVSSHHRHQGDYQRDYEHEDRFALTARQAYKNQHPFRQRLVTLVILAFHCLPFGFLVSDYLVPRFYRASTGLTVKDINRHIPASHPTTHERLMFIAVSLASNALLFWLIGFWAWLYHNWALSLFLGKMGVMNLGQSLSEHDGDNETVPTRSTYGPINLLLFNTGYHLEHHVFVNVPWNKLPMLTRLAPEVFCHANKINYARHWWAHVAADFSPSRKNSWQKQSSETVKLG